MNSIRDAVELAKSTCPPLSPNASILYNSNNAAFIPKTFNNHWLIAVRAANETLGYLLTCTFHDLKAKGISDYEGSSKDKQLFSGHKTENQVLVYDRKIKISPTLNMLRIKKE